MLRKRLSLAMLLPLFAVIAFAQSKYALSFSDYMDGKFVGLENLAIKSRSQSKRF